MKSVDEAFEKHSEFFVKQLLGRLRQQKAHQK